MNRALLKTVTFLIIALMLSPSVLATPPSANKIVVVGSVDPQLGYDEIVNGTTTFIVARKPKIVEKMGYHNITRFEWKSVRVEASPEVPGACYDKLTGKYYFDNVTRQSYDLTVPDPNGTVTVFLEHGF
jgi:hypothetical protein